MESIGKIHLLKLFEINFYFVFILFVIKVYKIMSRLLPPLHCDCDARASLTIDIHFDFNLYHCSLRVYFEFIYTSGLWVIAPTVPVYRNYLQFADKECN